jgi:predicted SprT family Zn-dependent metalloprotease
MVHEMIHYYIAWNRIKDNGHHGKKFMEIANKMNEEFGLNITKIKDASSYKLSENAPEIIKKKSFFSYLFG